MPRPKNKAELIEAATANYDKLLVMIECRTDAEKNIDYDFSEDEKKKEAHWKRDKNLRDVLMHLNEWHELLLEWIKNYEDGGNRPFLMEGYTWKNYGDMNMVLFTKELYPWVGGSNIGSYFISTTSSHYDWAMKKMKAHKKNLGVK